MILIKYKYLFVIYFINIVKQWINNLMINFIIQIKNVKILKRSNKLTKLLKSMKYIIFFKRIFYKKIKKEIIIEKEIYYLKYFTDLNKIFQH